MRCGPTSSRTPAPPTETSVIAVITARKLQRSNRPPCGRFKSTVDDVRIVVRGLRPAGPRRPRTRRRVISEKTVRNHVSNVFDKLGVWTRAQAIVLARDRGFRAG